MDSGYQPALDAELDSFPFRTICLSGGGYRAALFHVGGLRALGELGDLPYVGSVSASSGGSITAAVFALNFANIRKEGYSVDALEKYVVRPVESLAGTTIDRGAIVGGLLRPGSGSSDLFIKKMDSILFHGATMHDVGRGDFDRESRTVNTPLLFINTTEMRTGSSFTFSNWYTGNDQLGFYPLTNLTIAEIVAASSAFPPFMSPIRLSLAPRLPDFPRIAGEASDAEKQERLEESGTYDFAVKIRQELILVDGGVLDNAAVVHCMARKADSMPVISRAMNFYDVPQGYKNWFKLTKDAGNLLHDTAEQRLYESFTSNRDPEFAAFVLRREPSRSTGIAIDDSLVDDYLARNAPTSSLSAVYPLVVWLYLRDNTMTLSESNSGLEKLIEHYAEMMCLANVDTRYKALSPDERNALINLGFLNMYAAVEMRSIIGFAADKTEGGPISLPDGFKINGVWNGRFPRPLPGKLPKRCQGDEFLKYEAVLYTANRKAKSLLRNAGIQDDPLYKGRRNVH